MFHVKHSAFSCFFPLFFGFLLSFVSPFVFRFFLPLCSSRCFFFFLRSFWGVFLLFAFLGRFLGVFFLILGWLFAPFSSFRVPFLYFFRNFCGFRLALPVLSGRAAVFLSSFCSFSFFSFAFFLVFLFFCFSRVIFGGVFPYFFVFSYFFLVSCALPSLFLRSF